MKFSLKPTYLIIGLALALSACSHDDMPDLTDGDDNRIVFRTSLQEIISRAEVTTEKNLHYFYVTAFDMDDHSKVLPSGYINTLFANQKVETVIGREIFTSPNCVWPDPGKEIDRVSFFAFSPGLEKSEGATLINHFTPEGFGYKLTGFRVASDIADQVDFVTAYTTGTMADNLFSGVMLPFAHQLSRIEVKAYGTHKSCDIEIAGVRIGGTGVENTFNFKTIEGGGEWAENPTRGIVEYIYRKGDKIVVCGNNHHIDKESAVSIMGAKHTDSNDPDGYENCAMLIPGNYTEWDYANDRCNGSNQMYISVLIRVTDATLTAGIDPVEKQRYPYKDLTQGADSYDIPKEYFAVNKTNGVVSAHIYKNENGYFSDSKCTDPYKLESSDEIKEFGWAALPITGTWAPGKIYTYTLDYTVGVGLHDPSVTTTAPAAGDAIISDKVGISYDVTEWKAGGGSSLEVPGS